jgi:hypothetical protein
MIRSWAIRKLAFALALLYAAPGFAWGPEGHRLVARIAQNLLTPETAARIQATLAPDETIAARASWADEVRRERKETEPWHFIDIEITGSGLDMRRDCPNHDCVLAKITEFRKLWKDPTASRETRREALLFLVHFAGDMHQPLHCADNHDKGANDVQVEFLGEAQNLHRLWDSGVLNKMPPEEMLFARLRQSITPERQTEWSRGTVEDWAVESFHAAQKVVYGNLPKVPAGGPSHLGEAYQHAAETVIEQRIAQAGVRLAAILNEMP